MIALLPILLAGAPAVSAAVNGVSAYVESAGAPSATSPAPAEPVELAGGWRVRPDPGRRGLAGRWDAAGLDDRRWAAASLSRTTTAEPVWFRRWVDLPGSWPRALLVLEGAAGRVDLWVNGVAAGRDLGGQRTSNGALVRDITRLAGGKPRCLIALLVAPNAAGPGGIGRALVAPDAAPWAPSARDLVGVLAQGDPELPWPSWARGEGAAWVALSEPGGSADGVVGWRGEVEAGDRAFAVSCWLFDRVTGRFHAAPAVPCQLRLSGRYLPLPAVSARAGTAFSLTVTVWPYAITKPSPAALAVGEATVENSSDRPREADLIIAVHPFGARGEILPLRQVRYEKTAQAFWVNGRPALLLPGAPDTAGAAPFGGDWTLARQLARGEVPAALEAGDPAGLASGAAVYHLRVQPFGSRTQSFRLFLSGVPDALSPETVTAVREVDRKVGRREIESRWQKLVAGRDRVFVRVSDKNAQDAFYASVGHLLVALAGGRIGAADRSLAAAALLRVGHAGTATSLAAAADGWALAPAMPVPQSASALVEGTWRPAEGFEAAWGAGRAGDGETAWKVLRWWLAHPTTPGAHAWAGRSDPVTGRYVGGDLPDPRAAALYICAVRDLLVREEGASLLLASGLPEEWIRPGRTVELRNAPTSHGILPGYALVCFPGGMAMRLLSAEKLANRGRGPMINPADLANPPGGLKWRIPGTRRIRSVIVDRERRKDIPADRVLSLPGAFREVRILW